MAAGILFLASSVLQARGGPVQVALSPTVAQAPAPVAADKEPAEKAEKPEEAVKEKKPEEESAPKESPEPAPTQSPAPAPAQSPAPVTAPPADTTLYLTVPKMGRYNDPVFNSVDPGVLTNGAGKLPASGFPWEPGSNTYIAAHVYGYPGTGSWQQFAALPSMTYGDQIILTDANGTEYVYQVTEILQVSPYDVWVTSPVPGKDMVSLQTCVGPGWSERLIVRGERVSTS